MLVRIVSTFMIAFVILGIGLLSYFLVWVPEKHKLESAEEEDDSGANSTLRFLDNRGALFDRLVQYLAHPETECGKTYPLDEGSVVCLDPGPGLDELRECFVFSFGLSDGLSFEQSLHKKYPCFVFGFDPVLGKRNHSTAELMYFFDMGIAQFDRDIRVRNDTWKLRRFRTLLDHLKRPDMRVFHVVKLDIGDGELYVLQDMLNDGILKRVNHLFVELHLRKELLWDNVLRLLKKIEMEAGLGLFSTRPKTENSSPIPGLPRHQHAPLVYKMAWVRKR